MSDDLQRLKTLMVAVDWAIYDLEQGKTLPDQPLRSVRFCGVVDWRIGDFGIVDFTKQRGPRSGK